MEAVFTKIENATVQELQEIMAEVEERFAVAFPQWEVLYLRGPAAKKRNTAQCHCLTGTVFVMLFDFSGGC